MSSPKLNEYTSSVWGVFELLRGRYKRHEYGQVILPFVLLRRLDCILEPTKTKVLAAIKANPDDETGIFARKASGYKFWNESPFTFETLAEDTANLRKNLVNYVNGFSKNIVDIFEHYEMEKTINDLHKADILLKVFERFAALDLHPETFSNHDMADMFEHLIREDAESANMEAGEYFTPRDVIRLLVDLLVAPDADLLTKSGKVCTIYDPTAGTGGMLSLAEERIAELNPKASVTVYAQELNPKTYSICKADMLVKGQDVEKVACGDTLKEPAFRDKKFDYCLANPPYGVEWKPAKEAVEAEHKLGAAGRFGAGLPRISDGQLLFLQHIVSHLKSAENGGGRAAIVFNGSPLFTGGAGSGESDIRGRLISGDLLEAIIALPNDIFFNTGISTYIWIINNRKSPARKGKVQLINGAELYAKRRKSLGSKRNELEDEHIKQISKLYAAFKEGELCKIFDNDDFSYREVIIERPLRQDYAASAERLARLKQSRLLAKITEKQADKLLAAISANAGDKIVKKRAEFIAAIEKAIESADVGMRKTNASKIADELAETNPAGEVVLDSEGKPLPDADLRDTEIVPSGQDIKEYFESEVRSHAPDAWISPEMPKTGYEIPFTRHFYKYQAPRDVKDIDDDIRKLAREITELLEDSAK
jgi:type I restriction enzyme M protein